MPRLLACFIFILVNLMFHPVYGQDAATRENREAALDEKIEALNEPLYKPFIERYVLDELKHLRQEMAQQRIELVREVVDREHSAIDRAVSYATNTITYFFYLIAAVSSILVIVGWTSIREIKEKVHKVADEEISKLISEYEERLAKIEQQLNQKTQHIEENREEIELTRNVQALWLRAARETTPQNKISVYDQILHLSPEDVEALTFKADAVLELNEPQWAANLCLQALELAPDDDHAFYQLACAYATLGQDEEAIKYLKQAINMRESYREDAERDPAFVPLASSPPFIEVMKGHGEWDT